MSLDRTAIPRNVLDRLLEVERRLDDLEGFAALPVADPEGGDTTYVSIVQEVEIGEGPGIDVTGTSPNQTVGLGGDTILLYDSGGAPVAEFAATDAGLTAALAAAGAGDVIRLPACAIGGNHTIPAGVMVLGFGESSVLSGTITNHGTLTLINCSGSVTNNGVFNYVRVGNIRYVFQDSGGNGFLYNFTDNRLDINSPTGPIVGVTQNAVAHFTRQNSNDVFCAITGKNDAGEVATLVYGVIYAGTGGPAHGFIGTQDAFPMMLRTDNSTRVTIKETTGRVGIGTVSPEEMLHVIGNIKASSGQLISMIATGTAPLIVASTTLVSNLNADLLDAQEGAYYLARDHHTGVELFGSLSTLTLAGGVVTINAASHVVAAETGTDDDLATINGGTQYQLLLIRADAGDTITVKHGTGNIRLNGGADFELSGAETLCLFYDGTNWSDVGAGGGGFGTDLTGLGTGNRVARWDGTDTLQDSHVIIDDDGKTTFPDSASIAPLNVTERSAAPLSPSAGDIYLDDGTNTASGNAGWRRYTGAGWEDITAAAGSGAVDASVVTYTPSTAADWFGDADPGNLDDALDQLAGRVDDLEVDGDGGGDSTHTAAYASRPAASNAGDLFLPSDGFVLERDTGAAWAPWGPLFPLNGISLGDFSWVNQGTATATAGGGGIYVYAPAAAGWNARILVKSAPSTPYTVTVFVIPHLQNVGIHQCGILFRQSSDGKLATLSLTYQNFACIKANGPTSWNSNSLLMGTGSVIMHGIYLRITDDGTNRTYAWSLDGQHFLQLYSEGRTTFLTADQIGFLVQTENDTYPAGATFLSWKES